METFIRFINGKRCFLHHYASRRGYCRKDSIGVYESYTGKFGSGFIERLGRYNGSTYYEYICYWIFDINF